MNLMNDNVADANGASFTIFKCTDNVLTCR